MTAEWLLHPTSHSHWKIEERRRAWLVLYDMMDLYLMEINVIMEHEVT